MNIRSCTCASVKVMSLVVLLSFCHHYAQAQMFSIKEDAERNTRPTLNNLMIGISPVSFSYKGNLMPSTPMLDYDDLVLKAQLESPTLHVYASYGNKIGTNNDITAFNIGAIVMNRITLSRKVRQSVYLPFRVLTDWRTTRNNTITMGDEEFQQSSVMVGTGLGLQHRFSDRVGLDLNANGNYGYSVRSFGAEGGTSYMLEGKARLNINRVINTYGLSIGYDYQLQAYLMSNPRFDYELQGHSILIGLRF